MTDADYTFDTDGSADLQVQANAGSLHLDCTAAHQTTIRISGPSADEFKVEHHGSEIQIAAPKRRFSLSADPHIIEITAPPASRLAARLAATLLRADGALGTIRVKAGSGEVDLEHVEGDAVVETGSGAVRIRTVNGDVRVRSGSGDVTIESIGGTSDIATGSGDITLGTVGSRTVANTGSGDVVVGHSATQTGATSASGTIVLKHVSAGSILAKNVSGDIRVGIPAGTPVWTDINSTVGRIINHLPRVGKPAPGQPYVEVRATTLSGEIVLTEA